MKIGNLQNVNCKHKKNQLLKFEMNEMDKISFVIL